ncbi:MAG: response regulator [Elusimicrobia bacterium]|nr:response regulator [Elusimicrobiota bacterium]
MTEHVSTDPKDKKILIADDDEGVRCLVEVLMRTAGFDVVTATTGEDAIRKLDERPDALILDLIMPGCGGVGVLAHLKSLPEPRPPVIVITAYVGKDASIAKAAEENDVIQCQAKPLDHEALLAAVHRCTNTKPQVP